MQNFDGLKIAIIHDQLTQYGGAEKTLESLLEVFPGAHIYTGFCKPINISKKILSQRIFCGKVPSWLGFLMPLVFEGFDLRSYDIIISEGTAWPKGVLTTPKQLHVSYVYTPPRFLYGYPTEGQKRDKWYLKPFLIVIDHFLRIWDFSAAQRPDFMLSISQEVAKRVKTFYRRDSQVIYPPVEILKTTEHRNNTQEQYYLCISRLAAYKNIDLLIQAFNLTNLNLRVAGTGKEEKKLKATAKTNVTLLGFVSDAEKTDLLANCKGFVFPTDHEDFGIVLVEALSHGKPILCHNSGGPLEIVNEGTTGMYFTDLTPKDLSEKIREFDRNIDAGKYHEKVAKDSVEKFGSDRFKKEFGDFVKQGWEEKQNARTS